VPDDAVGESTNADWVGYGADVLAVADGTVRDARDGQGDGRPMSARPEPTDLTARGLYGNLVVLDIGRGVFAHYAHLQPGSVRVRPGQRVHRGDVLARLGNSGNSAAPHLHFHLSDRPTFEGSEGLPFRFARLEVEGDADERGVLSRTSVWTPHPLERPGALPLDGTVIAFPAVNARRDPATVPAEPGAGRPPSSTPACRRCGVEGSEARGAPPAR
jgi:murein DD-endopeptidase MepM/ murein hydrolase activator NlpD